MCFQDPAKTYLTATNDNGTPMYMAPEQFNGSHLDEKVDVYALGCILNECLTRRQPWRNMPNFFQVCDCSLLYALYPALRCKGCMPQYATFESKKPKQKIDNVSTI